MDSVIIDADAMGMTHEDAFREFLVQSVASVSSMTEQQLFDEGLIMGGEDFIVRLDYRGDNIAEAKTDLIYFFTHKGGIIHNFISSETIAEASENALAIHDFLRPRGFEIFLGAENRLTRWKLRLLATWHRLVGAV